MKPLEKPGIPGEGPRRLHGNCHRAGGPAGKDRVEDTTFPTLVRKSLYFQLNRKHREAYSDSLASYQCPCCPFMSRSCRRTGAVLIILYAVVVPVVKLLLLAVGEIFRHVMFPKTLNPKL